MSGTLDPEYRRQHYAINKARGKAAEWSCVGCDGNAQEWAWVHGADRNDVFAYQPMCRSCHQKYDNHWSEEARAKVSQSSVDRWAKATPELRERMGGNHTAPHTAETRAKISAAMRGNQNRRAK